MNVYDVHISFCVVLNTFSCLCFFGVAMFPSTTEACDTEARRREVPPPKTLTFGPWGLKGCVGKGVKMT